MQFKSLRPWVDKEALVLHNPTESHALGAISSRQPARSDQPVESIGYEFR